VEPPIDPIEEDDTLLLVLLPLVLLPAVTLIFDGVAERTLPLAAVCSSKPVVFFLLFFGSAFSQLSNSSNCPN